MCDESENWFGYCWVQNPFYVVYVLGMRVLVLKGCGRINL